MANLTKQPKGKKLPPMYYAEPEDTNLLELGDVSSMDSADPLESMDYAPNDPSTEQMEIPSRGAPARLDKLRRKGMPSYKA